MADKKMRAYQVQGYEYGVIVYAVSNVIARRQGASELGEEFEHIESCRLAPWADEYFGKNIPCEAWWENGLWLECNWCESRVSNDDESRLVVNDRAFCSTVCANHFAERE